MLSWWYKNKIEYSTAAPAVIFIHTLILLFFFKVYVLINSVETNANKTYIIIITLLLYVYTFYFLYTFVYLYSGSGECMAKKRQTPLSHCCSVVRRHIYARGRDKIQTGAAIIVKTWHRGKMMKKKIEIRKPLQYVRVEYYLRTHIHTREYIIMIIVIATVKKMGVF